MSWQLASFTLLAAALAAGFAWYERSRPSARVLALVGTLAALAVLGRVAFAPVPNIKPTTDIVLLSGYVLGGAPGFAVGAVAALASNLFFTQGPWTPWQMAAWGTVGVGGALLARAGGRRLGRIPLALACGLAGLLYGVLVNFGSVVTFGGGDLWHRYLVYQGASVPWDLIHAGGNVAFFLVFGPALVRTLRRFRTRTSFRWASRPATTAETERRRAKLPAAAATIVAVALAASLGFGAVPSPEARAASPADWLVRQQSPDGGFAASPGRPSASLYTGWAALGLAADGRRTALLRTVRHMRANADELTRDSSATEIGDLERTILVLVAAGRSPRRFAGRDLVRRLTRRIGRDGSVLGQVNLTAFAVLALRAADVPASAPAVRRAAGWLVRQQNGDGGYSFLRKGLASDVDDTAAVVQALATLPGRRATVRRAVAYLRRAQNADGGLPQMVGGSSNVMSTAWAIQAFAAARVPLARVRVDGGRTPLGYVRSLILPSGQTRYSRTSDQTPVWSTASAVLALSRKPLPLRPGRASAWTYLRPER